MIKRSYYWPRISERKLKELEFKYSSGFSTPEDKAFIKFVPLYRYSEFILLEARIVAYLDGEVKIDVMDANFHSYYASWYLDNTIQFPFLKAVNIRLEKLLKKYGIKEITENDGSKDKEIN